MYHSEAKNVCSAMALYPLLKSIPSELDFRRAVKTGNMKANHCCDQKNTYRVSNVYNIIRLSLPNKMVYKLGRHTNSQLL